MSAPTPYYERDGITVYVADCMDVLPHLERVDHVITDPPYGIALENHGRKDGQRRDRDWTISGDGDQAVGQRVLDYCLGRGWGMAAFASPRLPWKGDWRSLLVWHKYGLGMGGDPGLCWRQDWELIQVAQNGPLTGGRDSAVLIGYDMRPADFEFHPCQKPISLMKYLILKLDAKDILDPFAGSLTTAVAAKHLGRRCIAIEREEKWAEAGVKRLAQMVMPLEVP